MNKLRELRRSRNLSITELSDETGIARSTLSAIEHGNRKININHAQILAPFFNVSVDFLLGFLPQGVLPKISIGDNFFHCPNCGSDILYKSSRLEILKEQVGITHAYCSRCGTKLDWSIL